MADPFAGGYVVNEKLNNTGGEQQGGLYNLNGKPLQADGAGIYGAFDLAYVASPKEKQQLQEKIINLKAFSEHPVYPILKRYSGKQTEKDNKAIENIIAKNTVETDIFKDLEQISKKLETAELKSYIENFIIQNKTTKNKEQTDETGEIVLPKQFEQETVFIENKDSQITQLLAENYVEIPQEKGEKQDNFVDNMNLTFEITKNKVLEGKQIYRTDSFEDACKDIEKDHFGIEEKFYALSYIHEFVNTDQGSKGEKNVGEYTDMKKEKYTKSIEQKKELLKTKFHITNSKQLEQQYILNKEVKKIVDDIKRLDTNMKVGDVFEGGEMDKASNNPAESKKD